MQKLNDGYIKPAFNHLGNKRRIIHELISNFPKTDVVNFVEPFAGSGIVTSTYKIAQKYWLNDSDKNLALLLEYLLNNDSKYIIHSIEKIIKQFKLPCEKFVKYNEQYSKLKIDYNKNHDLDKLLVLVLYGFNHQIRFNNKDEFNIPPGKFYWNLYQKNKLKKL